MDIYEIAAKSGVSIRTLKKLEKMGFLNVTLARNPVFAKIQYNLRKGNSLTAEQLLHLVYNPEWLARLPEKHIEIASDQVDNLGHFRSEAMPWQIAAEISAAGTNEQYSVDKLVTWLTQFIDHYPNMEKPRDHAYIAIRMLYNIPQENWIYNVPFIAKALLHVRQHPKFLPYFEIIDGKTFYRKPKIIFDM